jgi:hypothetical protein
LERYQERNLPTKQNKMKKTDKNLPTKADIELFSLLYPMLIADLGEMRELSKKKQDGIVNKLKVTVINKKLEKIKAFLERRPTHEFLELLDDESLPTNSDAVFTMIQFKSALEHFRNSHFTMEDSEYHSSWKTSD